MDKILFLEGLFLNLKDNICSDSDVDAVYNILRKASEVNIDKSIEWFKDIVNKYDIKNLRRDIDFLPLVRDYPVLLIKKRGIKDFINILNDVNKDNVFIVLINVFNIYDDLAIMSIILDGIREKNDKEVLRLIEDIKMEEIKENILDFDSFLEEVIKAYINNNYINKRVLLKITDMGRNDKAKALLKALIIDYI